ncbi:C40 family peptidase [Neobacillus cucumis]|uniref:Peptidoglycan endopeptidase n=1 Tax=Neobacillus cucumis TaxID=1740721 RepID=A0A2N5HVM5_9BACI|nr:C40 family peptidase [Neobacillus cucumis]PLS09562.1 peptidoglycan endopeptidase [Neobacillus cucumis]
MKKQFITTIAALGILAVSYSSQASAHELIYTVQSGDSLWKIATTNKLSVEQVMQYNHLSSSTIRIGQKFSLLAPHAHTSEKSTYTVKYGDSLSLIAKIHNTSVSEIKSINHLTTDLIKVGQVLKMPGVSVTPSPAPVPEVKKAFNADALITEAKKYLGVPYVWGGSTPAGFDCSGFLNYVFAKQGVSLPRTVASIWNTAAPVSAPKKGDIVFFNTAGGPSHAGIYIGDNKFIHAGSSTGVTITDMNSSYWKVRYLGAKSAK